MKSKISKKVQGKLLEYVVKNVAGSMLANGNSLNEVEVTIDEMFGKARVSGFLNRNTRPKFSRLTLSKVKTAV